MDHTEHNLVEWITTYLKHKSLITRDLISIEKNTSGFLEAKYKTKTSIIIPLQALDDTILSKFSDNDAYLVIVTWNTKSNLQNLISKWKTFAERKNLVIYFINPNSSIDKRWTIYPYTHNRISEPSALKLGLETLFRNVEEIHL